MRLWTGVCETLMPDVLLAKAHHRNDHSYVHELSGSSMVGGYTKDLNKSLNCQNWGVGTCAKMAACPGQYGSYSATCRHTSVQI